MAKRKDPATQLAENLVALLEARRGRGGDAYPVTLQQLFRLADPAAPPELGAAALTTAAFKKRAVVAQKDHPESPVALREDLGQLAASPWLLEHVLGSVCTPAARAWPVAKLKARITAYPPAATAPLRRAFEATWQERIEQHTLPEAVGVTRVKQKPLLFLKRLPPEPTPEELAGRFREALAARRRLGDGAAPPTLRELAEAVRPGLAPELLKKVLAVKEFKNQIVVALAGNPESPVALAGEAELLAGSRRVLELALEAERLAPRHVAAVKDVARHLPPPLRTAFTQTVRQQIEADALPPAVGLVWHKKLPLLFRVGTMPGNGPPPGPSKALSLAEPAGAPAPATLPVPFEQALDAAFARLDREGGGNNFVSLVDLRRALAGVDRPALDAGLHRLRQAGRYSLRAAEGWAQLSPAERAAGIPEEGALLLFVTRNTP